MAARKKTSRKKTTAPEDRPRGDTSQATGAHGLPEPGPRGGRAGAGAAGRRLGATSSDSRGRTQERASDIWGREGRPHGRAFDHWLEAEAELASETNPRSRGSAATTSTAHATAGLGKTNPDNRSKQSRKASARSSRAKKGAQPEGPTSRGA